MKKHMAVRILVGIMALVVVAGAAAGGGIALEAGPIVETVADGPDSITGTGPWLAKMACATCGGVILAFGGSSIVGLIAIVGAQAAGVGLCAGFCTVGFF